MHPVIRRALIRTLAFHQWTYERTDGRLGSSPLGRPILLLRTVGCRTGQLRTSALLYVSDGDSYAVVASNGGARRNPAWFHNLAAESDAEVQIGRRRIPVRARVAEGEERNRLFEQANKFVYGMYRTYDDRVERQIAVVVLKPR